MGFVGMGLKLYVYIFLFLFSLGARAETKDPFELIRRQQSDVLLKEMSTRPELIKAKNKNGENLLMAAAYEGDSVFLKKAGPKFDLNEKDHTGHTAIYYAVSNSQEKASLTLIDLGADLNLTYDKTLDNLLHVAARTGMTKVIESIFKKASGLLNQKNTLGETPLFEAVRASQSKSVKALLHAGADRNIRNKKNQVVTDIIDPVMDKKIYKLFKYTN